MSLGTPFHFSLISGAAELCKNFTNLVLEKAQNELDYRREWPLNFRGGEEFRQNREREASFPENNLSPILEQAG